MTSLDFSSEKRRIQPKSFIICGGNGGWLVNKYLRSLGWNQLPNKFAENFQLKWVETRFSVNYDLFQEGEQLVNRIPNSYMITNKLGLLINLHQFQAKCEREVIQGVPNLKLTDFLPETYRIDDEKDKNFFSNRYKAGETWISKPIGWNQGRGIYLVRDLKDIKESLHQPGVSRLVQKYVTNPLLINGKKFDIRVYILISSSKPYLVLFREGYVRLSLQKYSNDSNDITVHLTNQYIQKRLEYYGNYKNNSIFSFKELNQYINTHIAPSQNLETDWVFKSMKIQMKQIALYTFLSVKHKLNNKTGYFDLYGLDFLIDEKMKIWLLEVNVNPSISTCCNNLALIMPSLLQETLDIVLDNFEKTKQRLPLLPCRFIKNYELLYHDNEVIAPVSTNILTLPVDKTLKPITVYQENLKLNETNKLIIRKNFMIGKKTDQETKKKDIPPENKKPEPKEREKNVKSNKDQKTKTNESRIRRRSPVKIKKLHLFDDIDTEDYDITSNQSGLLLNTFALVPALYKQSLKRKSELPVKNNEKKNKIFHIKTNKILKHHRSFSRAGSKEKKSNSKQSENSSSLNLS